MDMYRSLRICIYLLIGILWIPLIGKTTDDPPSAFLDDEISLLFRNSIRNAATTIRRSYKDFPDIFICYSSSEPDDYPQHAKSLAKDLEISGIPHEKILLDVEINRPGSGIEISKYIQNIITAQRVIIVGSPGLKRKYEEDKNKALKNRRITAQELALLAQRPAKMNGVIPIWVEGDPKDHFPDGLLKIPYEAPLKKDYPKYFFRLLTDLLRGIAANEAQSSLINPFFEAYVKARNLKEEDDKKTPQRITHNIKEEIFFAGFKKKVDKCPAENLSEDQHFSKTTKCRHWQAVTSNVPFYSLPDRRNLAHFIESSSIEGQPSYLTMLWQALPQGSAITIAPSSFYEASIAGMGGIGKTTLALAYAYEALDNKAYDLIYWIYSETEESLLESYKKLLRTLKVPLKADDTQEQIIDLVKEHITQKQKWLLIYDNVPHPTFLENKTPQYGGHIVITSRCNGDWGYQPLGLEVFRPSEATAYLFRASGIQPSQITGEQQEQAQAIAKELGFLPLALSHAASYMTYLKEIEPFKHYLQRLSTFPVHHFERESTLFKKESKLTHEYFIEKTFSVAGEIISPLARRLITYFSYLDPEHIKADYFIGRNNHAREEVQEALAQLRAFSLIREHQGFISLHRLLQLVIRNKESMCFRSLSTNILTPMLICFENYIEELEENIKKIILNEKEICDNIEYIVQLYENAYMFPSHVKSVCNHLDYIASVKKYNEAEDFLLKLRYECLERYQTESVFSLLRNALNKVLRYLRLSENTELLDKYKKRIKTLAIQEEFRMREIDLYDPLFKEVEKVLPEIFSLHKGKEDTIYIAELCKGVEREKRLKYIDHLRKLLSSEQEGRDAMRIENDEYMGEPLLSRFRRLGITEHPFLIMFLKPEMTHRERLQVLDFFNNIRPLWQQFENYIKENQ